VLASVGGAEIVGPGAAGAGIGDHGRVVELEGRELAGIDGPIRPHLYYVRRDAGGRQDRASLVQRVGGGDLVLRGGRQLDHETAGRLSTPRPGERKHICALLGGEAAAVAADEQLDRAHAFGDGNRVPQPIVGGGGARHRGGGEAAGQHGGAAAERKHSGDEHADAAAVRGRKGAG